MIHRAHHWTSTFCDAPENLPPSMKANLDFAVQNYGFLIPPNGKPYTFKQFANMIKKVYDAKEPHTAEILKTLREI